MKPGKITLAEFLERWLNDYGANLAPRTIESYRYLVSHHIAPSLGSIVLSQLKPEHVQAFYSEKLSCGRCDGKGGLSARSVRHLHMVLHDALHSAVKWGLLSRNAADAVDPPHVQRPEVSTWDQDDVKQFLEAAKNSHYFAFFYLALFSGMRRSELLALRWSDVDLILGQIYVSRSLHHLADGRIVVRQPKTSKGARTVALPPSAVLVLREHRQKQALDFAMLGTTLTDDYLIFGDFSGKPLLPNTVTHAWPKLVRRAGLKGIRLHDARHTHASLLLKQGVHPKIVQERLGHSSIQITLYTYSHVAPGLQEAAANHFDEMFNGEAVRKVG